MSVSLLFMTSVGIQSGFFKTETQQQHRQKSHLSDSGTQVVSRPCNDACDKETLVGQVTEVLRHHHATQQIMQVSQHRQLLLWSAVNLSVKFSSYQLILSFHLSIIYLLTNLFIFLYTSIFPNNQSIKPSIYHLQSI